MPQLKPLPGVPIALKTYGPPSITSSLASSEQNKEIASRSLAIPQATPEDPNITEQFASRNLSNGSSAPPDSSCDSPAKQQIDNKTTPLTGQWPHVQSPCVHPPVRPAMHSPAFPAPICPYHHFLPYIVHVYWHPPPLNCPMAGPVPPFSLHHVYPSKFSYVEPELNRVGASPTNLGGVPTSSVTGTEAENWQANGHPEDLQDRAMEEAFEREDEEDEPVFVLTDEWMDFFAKSEARRQEKKKHRQKEAKKFAKPRDQHNRSTIVDLKYHPLSCLCPKKGHLLVH